MNNLDALDAVEILKRQYVGVTQGHDQTYYDLCFVEIFYLNKIERREPENHYSIKYRSACVIDAFEKIYIENDAKVMDHADMVKCYALVKVFNSQIPMYQSNN